MNFLNKLTAFLIIISYILSGEVFAEKRLREDGRRTPTLRQHAVNTPLRPERKKVSLKTRRKFSKKKTPSQVNKPEEKKAAAKPKAKAVKTEKEKKAAAKPKAKATPAPVKTAEEKKALCHYFMEIKTRDLPYDVRTVLKALGFKKEKIRDTPQKLGEDLKHLHALEIYARGTTRRIHNFLRKGGYAPANPDNKRILFPVADLSTGLQKYLKAFGIPAKTHSLSNNIATQLLNRLQQAENHFPGATKKMREFIKSKYPDFQG